MKQVLTIIFLSAFSSLFAQDEQVIINTPKKEQAPATKIFHSQKIINTKSVEVLRKGILEFNVAHSFGDIAGDAGGIKNFFGLDGATDIRIGFQIGLSDKLNLITARAKGINVTNQWELGFKYQFLKQMEGDSKHPLSLTIFLNNVISTYNKFTNPENDFKNVGDRNSQILQMMIARKFGKVSFQLNPLYLHTNYVIPGDDEGLFALGGAIRLPLSKKIVFLADYFHPFRSQSARDFFADPLQGNLKFYDPLGIGFEILTEGHVFHLNFTNATELLENRFIRRTVSSWGDGEFRWAFSISRNFILFREKKIK